MKEPEFLLKQVVLYRKLMSTEFRKKYKDNFCEEIVRQEEETLWKKRKCKIEKIDKKIEKAKLKTQQVTPDYLDYPYPPKEETEARDGLMEMKRKYAALELKYELLRYHYLETQAWYYDAKSDLAEAQGDGTESCR